MLLERAAIGRTLDEVRRFVTPVFADFRERHGYPRIGYVSGVVTADGPGRIGPNLDRLGYYTQVLQLRRAFPVFSAADIFTLELIARLDAGRHAHHHYVAFWRDILGSGHITDVFMTPRWEISRGATDEHTTARARGLRIHYVPELGL